jgi:large subunit ribosomal protein L30
MSKLVITQVKSVIDRPKVQKLTMESIGLRKVGQSVEKPDNDAIRGMINIVKHLVKVDQA